MVDEFHRPPEVEVKRTLREVFGFRSFRPHQEEIVESILNGRDVFAVMPTGGGKTLCYQLPARLLPGAAVVVSPLIALMKDQVDNARAMGLAAGSLNSASSPRERAETWRALREGGLDLLYVSPERLLVPDFLEELASAALSFFAIDEAHCVSEWGHDFRPDYLGLSILAERFPQLPIAAFTATATVTVAEDIGRRLGLRSPHTVRASFNRPNLYYQASPRDSHLESQILEIMALYPDESGLVYRATRRKVEECARELVRRGVEARPYHAGLDDSERRRTQEDFKLDRVKVIVATVAFGMGIDKSNVRFVIHGDLPKNLESYYQETGRAGRDGEPAHCALFYGSQEMVLWKRFADELPDQTQRTVAFKQLRHMINFAQQDACRRRTLLAYFGEELTGENCGACDICRGEVERTEATVPAQMALSAMARTGGRFGSGHLADILVGADTAKIRDNRHNLLPTYGVGRAYDRSFWRDLMAALLARGLAENTGDERFPTLGVSARAWPVLKGEEKFHVLRSAVKSKVRRRARDTALADPALPPLSEELLVLLKARRRCLAEEAKLPPYVIFSDRSLREMAQIKPTSPEEFMAVTGIGRHKLEKYGSEFMAIVAAYLKDHPEEKTFDKDLKVNEPAAILTGGQGGNKKVTGRNSARELTGRLLQEGLGLEETARARGLKPSTIIGHLEDLVLDGWVFAPDGLIDDEKLELATEGFSRYGDDEWHLRPVVEGMNFKISYDEARIARALLRKVPRSGQRGNFK